MIADSAKTNPKPFWSHVRRRLKTKEGIAPLLENPEDKSTMKFWDEEKANILQKQFCSVFTREPEGDVPSIPSRRNCTLDKIIIAAKMVKEEIDEINENKSCGPDNIHPKILKEFSDFIALAIALLLNKTMDKGKIPRDWKRAFVSAIYKKGSKSVAENYRPISLTSWFVN